MKNLSVRGQLLLGFGLVIAVFVISAIWISMLFDQNVKNNKWTMHTYEVLLESRDLLAALINIETGQRGYLLVGEESFLAPLRQGEQDFELYFSRIKELTGDNPVQQERLQRLHTIYDDWKDNVVEAEVRIRQAVNQGNGTLDDIVAMVRRGAGKAGMDSMRAIIKDIAAEERILLKERALAEAQSQQKTNLTLIISSVIGILAGVVIAIFFSARLIRQLGAEPGVAASTAQEISAGQLDLRLNEANIPAGSVMAAILQMAKQLKVIVAGIQSASEEVETTSRELSISSERSIRELNIQKE